MPPACIAETKNCTVLVLWSPIEESLDVEIFMKCKQYERKKETEREGRRAGGRTIEKRKSRIFGGICWIVFHQPIISDKRLSHRRCEGQYPEACPSSSLGSQEFF